MISASTVIRFPLSGRKVSSLRCEDTAQLTSSGSFVLFLRRPDRSYDFFGSRVNMAAEYGLDLSSHWIVESATLFYYSNPRVALFFSLGVAFLLYYLTTVTRKPVLVAKENGKFQRFLLDNCPTLHERYWPTPWCLSTHMMTACANFMRSRVPKLPYQREILELSDGGAVSLDWLDGGSGHPHQPIAFFMPGLTGCSQAEYIRSIVPVAARLGCRCVVFNNRGRGGVGLRTPKTYCALSTGDLREVLEHVTRKYPESPIIATGISLGGMIMAHYLCETKDRALVNAVMLISTVYDVHRGTTSMETVGLNMILNRHLARSLCEVVEPHKHLFINGLNMDRVLQSRTIREFDEHFTSKLFGFGTAEKYYTDASLLGKLGTGVKVPTLCVAAADDMMAPADALPSAEASESDYLALVITSRGGHIGFMEGLLPQLPFFTERLYEQYVGALIGKLEGGKLALQIKE